MKRIALSVGLGLSLTAFPVLAEEKAHEHGHAQLNIAVEDGEVEMELIAPGADIVGFEHAPGSDADRAAIQDAVAKLQAGLFSFSASAGCELEATGIYSTLLPDGKPVHSGEHHHDDDHKDEHAHGDHKHDEHAHGDQKHDEHEHGEEHAEFKVHYHYDCKDTASLAELKTTYFQKFPNAQEIDAAALTAKGQIAAELNPQNASLKF